MYSLEKRQILFFVLMLAALALGSMSCDTARRLPPVPTVKAVEGKTVSDTGGRRLPGISDPVTVSDEQNNIEVYRSTAPGVVFITPTAMGRGLYEDEERSGTGSGVVIDEQGHILTNEHVVAGTQRLTVTLGGGTTYPARIIGTDPDTDLAVIKIDAPREQLTVISLGDSDRLVVGQKVLAIGNPFGLDRTLTTGVISGLQRPIRARNGRLIEGAIQTDASINPGNSGGPLLDSQGRVIGINSQILSSAGGSVGVGFAIAVNIAKRVVPQLISGGRVARPRLGIVVRSLSDLHREVRLPVSAGLLVLQVAPGSAAEQAGIRSISRDEFGRIRLGDIITAVDGEAVKDQDDLPRILDRHRVGETLEVEIVRDGERQTVSVRLSDPTGGRRRI
jgi:S1-C subfamily serine protease